MDRLEFYKELYYKELESKEILATRFTTNVTLVTLLFGGLIFCIKNINDIKDDWWTFYPFLIFGTIAIIANIRILILLGEYLAGKEYEFMHSAKTLDDLHKSLKNYYQQEQQQQGKQEQTNPMEQADAKFEEKLINYYISAAHHNFYINDERIRKMGKTQALIIASVVATLLAISCYIPTFFKEDANVQKVEIFKSSKDKKEELKENSEGETKDLQEKTPEKKVDNTKSTEKVSKENENGK